MNTDTSTYFWTLREQTQQNGTLPVAVLIPSDRLDVLNLACQPFGAFFQPGVLPFADQRWRACNNFLAYAESIRYIKQAGNNILKYA